MTQGYKISWSTLPPSHRACHFTLRVKRIPPPFSGLCTLSRTTNPSLALAEPFTGTCWFDYSSWIFPHNVLSAYVPVYSKLIIFKTQCRYQLLKEVSRAQNPENTFLGCCASPRGKSVHSEYVHLERKDFCLSHFSYLAKGVGLGKNFFVSLR